MLGYEAPSTRSYKGNDGMHRRRQDFLWGCTLRPPKYDDLLVVALKTQAKTTKLTTTTVQIRPIS